MHTQDKQGLFAVAAIASVIFGWALVSNADVQDAENSHRVHCEMVALWEADAKRNVAPEQRLGHPNYDKRECGNGR